MDVPIETKMLDRCTDAPQKTPKTYGVYRCLPHPHDMWGTCGLVLTDVQWGRGYTDVWRHTDVLGAYKHIVV